jgi:hypothetical protein
MMRLLAFVRYALEQLARKPRLDRLGSAMIMATRIAGKSGSSQGVMTAHPAPHRWIA